MLDKSRYTLNQLATQLGSLGKFDLALKIASLIEGNDSSGSLVTRAHIALKLAEDGQVDQAVEVTRELRAVFYYDSFILRDIALKLGEWSAWDEACEIADLIPEKGQRYIEACRKIALMLADAGEFDRALEVAAKIRVEQGYEGMHKRTIEELTLRKNSSSEGERKH